MAGLEGTKTDRQALTGDISVKHGLDGESVTIVKITESTEDGGTNIVEFSDGSTLKIKNGSGGKIGIDGKSAYQYAQDGGYTGTEEEFALLMSQENLQTEKVDKISIEVSKLSEDIATKASAIKEKASGETIVTTDSAEAKPLGLAIDGKSEQNQYSGKNLINFENLAYSNGVAYTFKDDILVVVGDGKSGYQCVAYDVTNPFINNIGKNVSFGFEKITETVTGECSVELMLTDSDNKTTNFKLYDGSKKTSYVYTIPSNISSARFRIYTSNKNESNVVTNTVTIEKPMLYIGSEKTDYEPFTNLQPSPSPNYKQEIRNIGVYDEASGKYAVEVKGTRGNLAKIEHLMLLTNTNGVVEKSYACLNSIINVKGYEKIYISGDFSLLNSATLRIGLFNDYPIIGTSGVRYALRATGYLDVKDYDYVLISFSREDTAVTEEAIEELSNSFMINYGATPLPHEPYEEATATVLLDEPLRKGDKAYWNGGSKVRVDRYSKPFILTADTIRIASFKKADSGLVYAILDNDISDSLGYADHIKYTDAIMSEHFKGIKFYEGDAGIIGISIVNAKMRLYFGNNSTIASADDIIALLREWGELYIEYDLAEPITEEIDLSLDGLSMFYPTTVISNDCNANMEVEYIADTKAYIDKKFAELATAMV